MSIRNLVLLLAVIAVTAVGIATAHATNARTWVSGTGSDSGSCTRTAPCQTFSYALMQTASGGEINCLDPGGFGAVTISQSVTINCEGASNGGITVGGDAVAITINTANIIVNLIGLDLNGKYAGGGVGVNITAPASVTIRNCKIYGFYSSESAIQFQPGASGGSLVVDNALVANNTTGINLQSNNGVANMTVRNSTISNNTSYGIIVSGSTHAGATIEQTTLAFNNTGLLASGSGAVALIGGSTVVNNGTGVLNQGGTVYSFKNNQIGGNGNDGTPLSAYPGGPLN